MRRIHWKRQPYTGAVWSGRNPVFRDTPGYAGYRLDGRGEDLVFNDTRWEIRDGKSRVAAVSKMAEENLADHEAEVKIFLLTKEKMENMEQNRI